jgi:beta-lactamase class D
VKKIFTAFLFISLSLAGEETFLLVNASTNERVVEFGSHINERVTPACSFNIALSLMGYDAGVLKDENLPVWDFQEGYDDFSHSWKDSQTPKLWMSCSCVWYSKILTLQLGLEKIQSYLALFEYGNQDMSTGLVLPGSTDPAWVGSSLAISPREQVDFIQKMVQGHLLPVSEKAIEKTKTLVFKEELANGWKLYGKTGLAFRSDVLDVKVRWVVGWIERADAFFPFAYQMQEKEIDADQTVPRVKELLSQQLL